MKAKQTKSTVGFDKLAREYSTLWDTMSIVRSQKEIDSTVKRILEYFNAYAEVEDHTGVPWFVTGIMDMREGGGGAHRHLHNGDSLSKRTWQVPEGRPAVGNPPFTFLQSACDCHELKEYDQISDWSVERIAYVFEKMNGFGYRDFRNMRSPYLWGGTNHQEPGKYIADHVFDKTVMDTQCGSMALLRRLAEVCPEKVQLHSMFGATMDPAEPSPASNPKATPPPSVVVENANSGIAASGGLGSVGMTLEASAAATKLASLGRPPTALDITLTLLSSPTFFVSLGLLLSSIYFMIRKREGA